MKILMISAEVFPFAKTGGLADAVAALAKALSEKGNDVKIVMPRYYKIDRKTVFLLKKGVC
ncbi:glycogen/starch synthase, partial [Treponema porcinum]|uniref:glycogen/starch synthase n=1 Tax=Treponema porcinum TaxID=261392 RepID=UPI0023F1CE48